jgi:hypothetical protein
MIEIFTIGIEHHEEQRREKLNILCGCGEVINIDVGFIFDKTNTQPKDEFVCKCGKKYFIDYYKYIPTQENYCNDELILMD